MATSTVSKESYGLSRNAQNQWEGKVVYTVVGEVADIPTAEAARAVAGVNVGSAHPQYAFMFCNEIDTNREADNNKVWKVVATFLYEAGGVNPTEPDLATWTLSSTAELDDAWRTDFKNPDEVEDDGDDADQDIGGTPIDIRGEPRSLLRLKATFNFEMTQAVDVSQRGNYIATIGKLAGMRNKGSFLGAEEGQLLYLGADTSVVGPTADQQGILYKIVHKIAFDEFMHAIQRPDSIATTSGKQVSLGKHKELDNNNAFYENAYPVKWRQPFPTLFNFNALGIRV